MGVQYVSQSTGLYTPTHFGLAECENKHALLKKPDGSFTLLVVKYMKELSMNRLR